MIRIQTLTVLVLATVLVTGISCGKGGPAATKGRTASKKVTDLPPALRYPDARFVARTARTTEDGPALLYLFETPDSVPMVLGHYKSVLAGWKDYPAKTKTGGTALGFSSRDGKQIVVLTAEAAGPGRTTLSVYYVADKKKQP